MEKRKKRAKKGHNGKKASRGRVFQMTGRSMPGKPKPAAAPVEDIQARLRRSCHDCVFCLSSLLLLARTLLSGFPVSGMCANHPDTPGQLRPIPGRLCRNFRPKPCRVDPPEPPNENIRYIPLTRGLHAIVDAADYQWLSRYKWHALCSRKKRTFYAARNVGRRAVLMHRVIMKPPKGMVVDHINGNGLDNRRCNLRICTPAENTRNAPKRPGTRSRFIGVYPRGDKWRVAVTCNGEAHLLGPFDDEVEAAQARDRLARKLHGKYARLNFPLEDPQDQGQRGSR
jgi:hypothetical protein